jgi:hypothetical protein
MSLLIDNLKKKYPAYANIPDEKLTDLVGKKYPQYLSNPDFAREYNEAEAPPVDLSSVSRSPRIGTDGFLRDLQRKDANLVALSQPFAEVQPGGKVTQRSLTIDPEFDKAEWAKAFKQKVNYQVKVNPNDSRIVTAGKEIANKLLDVPEFLTSPAGLASLAVGGVFPRTLATLFGADALANAGQVVYQKYPKWDKLTPKEKDQAAIEVGADVGLAALLGHSVGESSGVRSPLTRGLETAPTRNAKDLAYAINRTAPKNPTLNTVGLSIPDPNSAPIPPDAFPEPQPQPPIPTAVGKNNPNARILPIAPNIPGREAPINHMVSEVKRLNLKTIPEIQNQFSNAKLNRQQARALRNQAFPELFPQPTTKGAQNATVQERSTETGNVGQPAGNRGEVGARVPAPEKTAVQGSPQAPEVQTANEAQNAGKQVTKHLSPNDLQPALLVDGKPVTGGDTHRGIYEAIQDPDLKDKAFDALVDDARHVFVNKNGKVYSREEAAKAIGEDKPLQSERLSELKEAATEPVQPQTASQSTSSLMTAKDIPQVVNVPAMESELAARLRNGGYVADADYTIEGIKKAMGLPPELQGDATRIASMIDAGLIERTSSGHYRFNENIVNAATAKKINSPTPPRQLEPHKTPPAHGGNEPTAMYYSKLDEERQKRGLPALLRPDSVSDQATMNRALSAIAKNKQLPGKLISELNRKPRPIADWERLVLLAHKIDLQSQFERAANEQSRLYDEGNPENDADRVAADLQVANLSDQLSDLENASNVSGTEQGRGLRALRILANEDYSLASLETKARAAKGGKPLTKDERAELKKTADDYKKANDELTQHLAEARNRISTLELNRTVDEIRREPAMEPHIRSLAEKIMSVLDDQASAALNRIKARRAEGRLHTGLDPAEQADYAIYGAAKIARGLVEFADWSASMVKDLGQQITPHLRDIFNDAAKRLNQQVGKSAASPRVETALKALDPNAQKAGLSNRIKAKIDAGKRNQITPQVQQLARVFVQSGITDRDALIDAVHGILQSIDPEITRRETMDAISGYGDFQQLSKDEISVALRGLKGEMQQVSKLEDMAAGVPPRKTGMERRTPTDEERRIIKAVNEAKIKFQVPITDPATQLKSALDTRKTQIENQIKDMQERLASGDFERKPRRQLKPDRRVLELQAQKEKIAKKFKGEQRRWLEQNQPPVNRAFDFISHLRRFSVLSGVSVLGKLGAYSATKLPTVWTTEAVGGVLGHLPGVKALAERAPSEGGFSVSALSRATARAFTQGIVDGWKTAKTGQSDLKAAYSTRIESGREWYNFFQLVHEVVKSPLRRAAFELSLAKRMEFASRHGADITDPMVQMSLAKDAYGDSDRALLLENNRFAGVIRAGFKQLEAKDKKTGEAPALGKAAATFGRVELPVLNVPLNYVKQTLNAAFGLPVGSVRLGIALRHGIDNLSPEEADAVYRQLKYGTIGGAMLLYGFYDGYKYGNNGTFGGFYEPGEKRREDQAGFGGIRVYGHNIPGLILHNPVLAVGQLGHTIGAILASKLNKRTGQTHSFPAAAAAGLMGLLNESPVGSVIELAGNLQNPRSADWVLGENAKGLVDPQLAQEIAKYMDKNAQGQPIQREPVTIPQHIMSGLPGLRQMVPERPHPEFIRSGANSIKVPVQ